MLDFLIPALGPTGALTGAVLAIFAFLAVVMMAASSVIEIAFNKRGRIKKVKVNNVRSLDAATDRVRKQEHKQNVTEAIKKSAELNRRANRFTLQIAIERAGWTKGRQIFLGICGVNAAVCASVLWGITGSLLFLVAGVLVGAVGLPFWYLKFMGARRKEQFVRELPTALDVISRTVRGGLPITDAIRIAGNDAIGPIREEFLRAHDAVILGRTLGDAIQEIYQRIPSQEINFMALVIGIQQRTGGNLTEVMDNLAGMLRERVILHKRVGALTQEVKLSAVVLAAVPLVVAMVFYYMQPDYVSLLWTTEIGMTISLISLAWAGMAAFMMKKLTQIKV